MFGRVPAARGIRMIATLLLIAMSGLPQERPLAWLVGTWCTDAQQGRTTCETWRGMDEDGVMQGVTVTASPKGEQREAMRIADEAGTLVFHAEPPGQAPADFRAVPASAPRSITFVNAAHDYPQRVRYWREGEMLIAEIALADGGKPVRWRYRRKAK